MFIVPFFKPFWKFENFQNISLRMWQERNRVLENPACYSRNVMFRDRAWDSGKNLSLNPSCVTLCELVNLSEPFFLLVNWG